MAVRVYGCDGTDIDTVAQMLARSVDTAMYPNLSPMTRAVVVQEALDAAGRSTYMVTLASVVGRLGQYMSAELRDELLRSTVPTFDDELLSETLRSWAPHLWLSSLEEAQRLAGNMSDATYKTAALAALAPHLHNSEKMSDLLKRVPTIEFGPVGAETLAAFGSASTQREAALQILQAVGDVGTWWP